MTAFVDVDVVWHRDDVVPMAESALLFAAGENGGDVVVPTELGYEGSPNELVGIVQGAAVLFTPGEDLGIGAALEHALLDRFVGEVEELGAGGVLAFAEVGAEFFPELAGGLKTDFGQHAGEINEAVDVFIRAAGERGGIGPGLHGGMITPLGRQRKVSPGRFGGNRRGQ